MNASIKARTAGFSAFTPIDTTPPDATRLALGSQNSRRASALDRFAAASRRSVLLRVRDMIF
jgi:hypothetical protein